MATKFEDKTYDVSRIKFFPTKLKLAKNSTWQASFNSKFLKKEENIYVYLIGTYTTLDGSKSYELEDLYNYDVKENQVHILLDFARSNIINIIKSVPASIYK